MLMIYRALSYLYNKLKKARKPHFFRGGDWLGTSCESCKCNTCKMNENGGIYGGCFDCEDCKEQDMYCEDCSMYEYDKYRLSN